MRLHLTSGASGFAGRRSGKKRAVPETRLATVSPSGTHETDRAAPGRLEDAARLRECPSCGGPPGPVFHRQEDVPASSCVLLESAGEAERFPRGSIELAVCAGCGCIWNTAF